MRLRNLLAVLCLGVGLAVGATGDAGATGSSDMFRAATVWHGQFGTPSLIKVGDRYWAYATTTGGDNLPTMWSSDLRTWHTRSAYPAGHNPGWFANYNDAFPHPASWADYYIHRNGRAFSSLWGPSVARIGNRYVLAYAVADRTPNRHCISLATSSAPDGPFVDDSSKPFVCSSDPNGSIDPQILQPGDGANYLVWKNAGRPGSTPTKVYSRRLTASGLAFAPGTHAHLLLQTARPWEGNVIENPAMIHYGSRYYLFYSGNSYTSSAYATGYAICAGPLGPCHRPSTTGPLLATSAAHVGPGGATPFVGPAGALLLAYDAWHSGRTRGTQPITLHIATLAVGRAGLLRVTSRG